MAKRFVVWVLAAVVLGVGAFCVASPGAAETVTYTYDSLGRLTGVLVPGAGRILYAYDAAGNIVSVTRIASSSAGADANGEAVVADTAVDRSVESLPTSELASLENGRVDSGGKATPWSPGPH